MTADTRKAGERALVLKLDRWLIPTAVVVYLLNYIDRVAVTAVRLQGLEQDLGLTTVQYETILAILYATYCPMQIPSKMTQLRPSIYIGACVVGWGLTSALTGVTTNFSGMMACRVFIGVPESIAAGILTKMQGILGLSAWRWLFYIKGAITMAFGFLTMWLLPDFPHNTRWLNTAEHHLSQVRLAEDAGEADKDSDNLILTATLGFSTTITLLMAFLLLTQCMACRVAMLGYIISLSTMAMGGRYFSLFLMTSGYCGFALTLTWVANTIPHPPAKCTAALGLVNGFGNLSNL
ncbi:major facilitator superfamily domain-containing protein [Suillus fuscotomentosus]|uniref:Major facilitator superfamily domain-containing protein n=1 Tax=Suillus fuscotomentosus TaxID=1912939 RepID=A0AAD4E7X1_9AGAM|nr:major facilitator superfamily domain-containing protein [Suillus fuscotomentosus]KAG1901007.1 major facilitator superfamily domain-containing protein [Suillus fuscotomentosus]